MAIFWNHIKGTSADGGYSWIKWNQGTDAQALINPSLFVGTTNVFAEATDQGVIMTDKLDWSLYSSWDWKRVSVNDQNETTILNQFAISNTDSFYITSTNAPVHVTKDLDIKLQLVRATTGQEDIMQFFRVGAQKGRVTKSFFKIGAKYSADDLITNDANFSVIEAEVPTIFKSTVECEDILHVKKYGLFDEYCRALYFSATSDRRAKENIKPNTLSALDFINKITVFSFNYKGHQENTIGIMAQDVLNTEFKDLLVDNINATGVEGDYMSIKEDKLIFVLLKAIQEQQKEIEDLKAQLRK